MNTFGGYADPKLGERMWRLRLFYSLADEASDIDPTSPIGLAVIDGYRPEMRCTADLLRCDDGDMIHEWIQTQYMGGTDGR